MTAHPVSRRFPLLIGVIIFIIAAVYMLPDFSLHGGVETGGTLNVRDACGTAPDSVIIVMTMYKDATSNVPSYEDRQFVRVADGAYTVRFANREWPSWQITNVLRKNGGALANDSCALRAPAPGENPRHCVVSGFPSRRERISHRIDLSIECECVSWRGS